MGDGAYLFDPQGDLRAWMFYPCKINCANPAQGQVALDMQPRKDEWISLRNTGGTTLDLETYVLKTSPYSYSFPQGRRSLPARRSGSTPRATPRRTPRDEKLLGDDGPDPQ